MISRFAFPTPILAGKGALEELPEQLVALGVKRPLIITDPGLLATSAMDLLRMVVPKAPVFSEVRPNPVETDVTAGAEGFPGACL